MHRCLQVVDIISDIANATLPDKRSLTVIARTCWTFYEPCMDALWRTIGSIDIFLDCFPADVWEIDSEGQVRTRNLGTISPQLLICRRSIQRNIRRVPQSLKDWERPLKNAARVRTLTHVRDARKYDEDIYRTLGLTRPKMYIFPQLLSLKWSSPHPSHILLFLSPTLTQLSLVGLWDGTAFENVLETAAHHSPHLKVLLVGTTVTTSPPIKPALDFRHVQSLRGLTALGSFVDTDIVRALPLLSTFPNLRELRLVQCTIGSTAVPSGVRVLPFLALRCLSLLKIQPLQTHALWQRSSAPALPGQTFVDLLKSITAPDLFQFDTSFVSAPSGDILRGIFEALSTHRFLGKLSLGKPTVAYDQLGRVNGVTLEPLLQLRKLIELDLEFFACTIEDSTLVKIASRWERISKLLLGCGNSRSPICATPTGLRAIAAGCRRLQVLGVHVDFSRLQSSSSPSDLPITNVCEELRVGISPPWKLIEVAACISDIFPVVKTIVFNGPGRPAKSKWNQVNASISTFAEIRRVERIRAEETLRLQLSAREKAFDEQTTGHKYVQTEPTQAVEGADTTDSTRGMLEPTDVDEVLDVTEFD